MRANGTITGAISTVKPGGIEAFRDGDFPRMMLARMAPGQEFHRKNLL